jgi:hypothetical protein
VLMATRVIIGAVVAIPPAKVASLSDLPTFVIVHCRSVAR